MTASTPAPALAILSEHPERAVPVSSLYPPIAAATVIDIRSGLGNTVAF